MIFFLVAFVTGATKSRRYELHIAHDIDGSWESLYEFDHIALGEN